MGVTGVYYRYTWGFTVMLYIGGISGWTKKETVTAMRKDDRDKIKFALACSSLGLPKL